MNSITRLILRGVVSGNVTLTPEVLGALKEVSRANSSADEPANSTAASANRPDDSARKTQVAEKHLTFINPLPGRWIRRTGCVMASVLLLGAGLIRAGINPGPFENANEAFTRGNHAEAARSYENIIAQQGWSVPVLFNLANAQQCAGQFGRAMLNYERAVLLAPNDPDIAANLQRVSQKAGLEVESWSRSKTALYFLTLNGWAGLAVTALFLLAAALPLRLLRPRSRRALNWGSTVAVCAFAVAVTAIVIRWSDLNRAVVTAPEAVAGVSPVTMAEPVFKLRAGETVRWKQTHGE